MTTPACTVELDQLLEYLLDGTRETEALEEHVFECQRCGERLDTLERLRLAVSDAVLRGALNANVNRGFLERAARDGLTMREYRVPAGESVACSAGPEDLFVVRLAGGFADVADLRLEGTFEDLEQRESSPLPMREVVFDQGLGEVVLVFPGALVRTYPRSRWTLRLHGETPAGPAEIGPFVMDHSP